MKILTIIGARPQFIKASALSRAVAACDNIKEVLVHTGQHYDANMSDVFFEELEIPAPRHNLGIGGGSHGQQTGRMLEALESVFLSENPDCVLVYGDTNSTLAGALAAAKLHIPIAHVEAGLRSFNRCMPEEVNRVLTDHTADRLFAPTEIAMSNLRREGLPEASLYQVGDIMYDVALHFRERVRDNLQHLSCWGIKSGSYVLATVHRAENTDSLEHLVAIWEGLRQFYRQTGIPVVLPLHPRTKKALAVHGLDSTVDGIRIIGPVGFLDMALLESQAALIVTDSGGVQKEAYFNGVPCATVRDETEWVELVQTGWNRLLPPSHGAESIAVGLVAALGTKGNSMQLYGDGQTAANILKELRC